MKLPEDESDQSTFIAPDHLRSIKHKSKMHGINMDDLFKDKVVLSNKNCFWSLLQSQTDRMHHYYYYEENHILNILTRANEDASFLSLALLKELQNRAMWLQVFVKYNIHAFELSVSKFDAEHHVDTFDEEMKYFQETYPFTNGERLTQILEVIDAFAVDIQRPLPRQESILHTKKLSAQIKRLSNNISNHSKSGRVRSKNTIRNLSAGASSYECNEVNKSHSNFMKRVSISWFRLLKRRCRNSSKK